MKEFINFNKLKEAMRDFNKNIPFNHTVIDDFLLDEIIKKIKSEFLNYNSEKWFHYKNALEDKKALNDWNVFPEITYSLFQFFNSEKFVSELSDLVGFKLYPDNGLHGGGWHVHGSGGNLNPHLDYSIHPKLGLQRKINIIIYVSDALEEWHGGHLGFWSNNSGINQPGQLVKEIAPKFNRAIIFDTTQNSWHGMA